MNTDIVYGIAIIYLLIKQLNSRPLYLEREYTYVWDKEGKGRKLIKHYTGIGLWQQTSNNTAKRIFLLGKSE